jgi:hypothetical protein
MDDFDDYLEAELNIDDVNARQAIFDAGIDSFASMLDLSATEIKEKIDTLRKPGGTIPNPAGAGEIRDPGINLTGAQALNLVRLHWYCYYCYIAQRNPEPENWAQWRANGFRLVEAAKFFKNIKRTEDKTERFKLPPKFTSTNARSVMFSFKIFLRKVRGLAGVPLSYLIRDEVDVPAEAINDVATDEDPGWGQPSLVEDLIRRARHDGFEFEEDNTLLSEYVNQLTEDTPAFSLVKLHIEAQNGRAAYFALHSQYMGSAYKSTTIREADKALKTIYFTGTARNFTFNQYLDKLDSAFNDKQLAGEPMTDYQKVRQLEDTISDPKLSAALTRLSEEEYMHDYARSKQFLSQQEAKERAKASSSQVTRRAAQVNTGGRGQGRGGRGPGRGGRGGRGGGRGRGETRYPTYDPNNKHRLLITSAWKALDATTQEQCRAARRAMGIPVRGDNKRKNASVSFSANKQTKIYDTNSPPSDNTDAGDVMK